MSRPRKSPEDRSLRWDALYVTRAERVEIQAAAEAADLSVSRYLTGLHRGVSHRRGPDRTAVLTALIQAERRLEALAQMASSGMSAIDAALMQAQLLDIERSFRREALLPGAVREEAPDEGSEAC